MSAGKASWRVAFTLRAEEDIKDIVSFIADRDGTGSAETLLNGFIQSRDGLRDLPDRGRIPPELKKVNILSYREIQVPPYRIVYQASQAAREVHIHVVADGRRNFTELLQERLLNIPPDASARQ
ncbi:MAG: type II toxin-antitoxin system RelE/ParE family toxin [Deltaproteobacteria bacterium]|jgi:toxin ParE1/3/4|nr:type II toxin-antitoxin system RelE/ParE family toxin [Deltaproteobacteria bacterium]